MKKSILPVKKITPDKKQPFGKDYLEKLLQQHFGHSGFRGKQLEAIQAVLQGKDCFCLMPTGGGKSMCYQIPALAKPGIVLVIAPLIALMENQVATLKEKGISAEFLSSTQISHVKEKIHEDLGCGKPSIRLLYVTPELVATSGFRVKLTMLYKRGLLNLIAIDEAHCISTWGHDFRPSYQKLSALRSMLPDIPILALTATAVPKVEKDVIKSLCLQEPLILRTSFNRPNIYYEVRYKDLLDDVYTDLSHLFKSSGNVCAVVYCLERSTCDDLSNHLLKSGIPSAAYHAGLNNKLRSAVLSGWLSSRVQVVVATVAFGMGIDRKDVRIVCHFNIPKSMESFYQESGRAGRDQLPSRSVLYYGLEDRKRMEFILRNAGGKKAQTSGSADGLSRKSLADFSQMVEYCEASSCRRKKILENFGEQVSTFFCEKSCDACKHPSLVATHLLELSRVQNIPKKGGSSVVFIKSSFHADSECQDSEFWNRDDDASFSDEDISDSDDRLAVKSALSRSKAQLDKRIELLQHAEELYYENQDLHKQKSGLSDKKDVTDALREGSKMRLLNALEQARQRLANLWLDLEAAASFLELECFEKYGKARKTFYYSQIAATLRWLSSASYEQIRDRLSSNPALANEQSRPNSIRLSSSSPHSGDPEQMPAEHMNQKVKENLESEDPGELTNVEKAGAKIELPPIPSFAEFVHDKGKEARGNLPSSSSSSSSRHRTSGDARKRPLDFDKHITSNTEKKTRQHQ